MRALGALLAPLLLTACGGDGPASSAERSAEVRARVVEIGRQAVAVLEPRWRVDPTEPATPDYCDQRGTKIDWGYLAWAEVPDRDVATAYALLREHWERAGATVTTETGSRSRLLFARFGDDYGFSLSHVSGDGKIKLSGSGPCVDEPARG